MLSLLGDEMAFPGGVLKGYLSQGKHNSIVAMKRVRVFVSVLDGFVFVMEALWGHTDMSSLTGSTIGAMLQQSKSDSSNLKKLDISSRPSWHCTRKANEVQLVAASIGCPT